MRSEDGWLSFPKNPPSVAPTTVFFSLKKYDFLIIFKEYLLNNQSLQFQYLFGLFLLELLRINTYSHLINHLLTMSNIRLVNFCAYDVLISSNIGCLKRDDHLTNTYNSTIE